MPDDTYDSDKSDEQLLALFRKTAFLQHGVNDAPTHDTHEASTDPSGADGS